MGQEKEEADLGQEEADLGQEEADLGQEEVVDCRHRLVEYLDSNQEHSTQVRKDMFRNLHSYMYK
jgi:N-glycosylase/DNA lyase